MKRVRASVKSRPAASKRLRFGQRVGRTFVKRSELKAFNVSTTFTADSVDAAATKACLSLTAQGSEDNNRIGRKITGVALDCRWQFEHTGAAGPTGDTVRILIVQDRSDPGAIPALSEILENLGTTGVYQQSHSNRYKILYDKTQDLEYNVGGALAIPTQSVVAHGVRIPLRGTISYDGALGAIGNAAENNIFVYCIGRALTAVARTTVTWESNLLFTDN